MAENNNTCSGTKFSTGGPYLWPQGTCPLGYWGDTVPTSPSEQAKTVCCRNCAGNAWPQPLPICKAVGNANDVVLCPGADVAQLINDRNAQPGATVFGAVGICVGPNKEPLVADGCGNPTGCAYVVASRNSTVPSPDPSNPQPYMGFKCSPAAEGAWCAVDRFACNTSTGRCEASNSAGGKPLAVCRQTCRRES